jgi:hypothetical protein
MNSGLSRRSLNEGGQRIAGISLIFSGIDLTTCPSYFVLNLTQTDSVIRIPINLLIGFLLQNIDKRLSIGENLIINRFSIVQAYSGALAGIHVFSIPCFSGLKKHLLDSFFLNR